MTYAMTLDNSWNIMSEEEMYDVNGGVSFWTKTAIIASAIAVAAMLTVAIVYFQFWLGATIMKLAIGAYITKLGAVTVATIIAGSLGVSITATIKLFEYIS
jgi:hypothetical protein